MRKIETWAIEMLKAQKKYFEKNAFTAGRLDVTQRNTRITTGKREDGAIVSSVYLHGNLIAQFSPANGWGFCLCGWNTPTTKSRLNAIASEWRLHGVSQKQGVLLCNGHEVPVNAWFTPKPL